MKKAKNKTKRMMSGGIAKSSGKSGSAVNSAGRFDNTASKYGATSMGSNTQKTGSKTGAFGTNLSKSFGRNWADDTYTGRAFKSAARALGVKGFAAGGIVGASARSYKDMRAGSGSGVGRIQKTKIAGRGR